MTVYSQLGMYVRAGANFISLSRIIWKFYLYYGNSNKNLNQVIKRKFKLSSIPPILTKGTMAYIWVVLPSW